MDNENKEFCVTHRISNQSGEFHGWMIFCPGCKNAHVFDSRWTFNGNRDKPTFRASMLVHGNPENLKATEGRYGHRCHSFVTDGMIQFLGDCTHELVNQTVPLEEF
jgi:hypothetical protein